MGVFYALNVTGIYTICGIFFGNLFSKLWREGIAMCKLIGKRYKVDALMNDTVGGANRVCDL